MAPRLTLLLCGSAVKNRFSPQSRRMGEVFAEKCIIILSANF